MDCHRLEQKNNNRRCLFTFGAWPLINCLYVTVMSLHVELFFRRPLDPPQITHQVEAHLQTCRTSSTASSRVELPVTCLLTEDSSQQETRLIIPREQLQGLQQRFQDLLHKQGSLAQGPNGATPANTGLTEESPHAGARKFASHSSAEECSVVQRWSAVCCRVLT